MSPTNATACSCGFAIVALVTMNLGSTPYSSLAILRNRLTTKLTCDPKTPR